MGDQFGECQYGRNGHRDLEGVRVVRGGRTGSKFDAYGVIIVEDATIRGVHVERRGSSSSHGGDLVTDRD